MNVELKNVGIVNHANIDLSKDLIILTGPNNTGKTYVAYVLYAIYKYPNEIASNSILSYLLENNDILQNKGKITFQLNSNILKTLLNEIFKDISGFLPSVFASEDGFFSTAFVNFQFDKNELDTIIKNIEINTFFKFLTSSIIQMQKEVNSDMINFHYIAGNEVEKSNYQKFNIPYILDQSIIKIILNAIFGNAYITPTERTAINLFSKEFSLNRTKIANILIENKSEDEQKNIINGIPRYSQPIKDSLAIAEDLANLQKNKSEYGFIADAIETEILKGKIAVSSNGEVLFNPNDTKVKNLNIHLSASVVKSLSNLVFYFRHLAVKNDFIIIDEPELNLHPDNQIIMARLIAKIVNNGFKVLISTHSDYIVKELNNLIRLNEADKNVVKNYFEEYQSVDFIDKNKVGVYLFKDKKAINIPVDEFGFEVSTIEKENNQLAEISERIYYEIFENKV
ncbi:MAG: ATP-binding protein [Sphingobacteriales bacterium]|nr:MAG: ATP-binding protein [Sphingobacteriales bacterium]